MTVIHIGIETTLAAVPTADCANDNIGYIWLNSYQRQMKFSTTATADTNTTDHPYYVRPTDNAYPAPGVWVENVGADQPEAWSANQIATGQLASTNLSATTGSVYDLDSAFFKLGGSSVNATGTVAGVFLGLDSSLYKFYAGDGSNQYIKFDGANLSWKGTNASLSAAGVLSVSNILATGGTVGGFTINATEGFYGGSGSSRVQMKPGAGFWAGATAFGSAPFRVSAAGALVATSASITGSVTATGGYIGGTSGWVISSGKITSSGIGLATTTGDATYAFWAGSNTPSSAEFRVSHAGALVATAANITGAITATSGSFTGSITATGGYIGGTSGWVISSGKITSSGIGLATTTGDATYAFWAGSNTPSSAEFRVSHAGALVATAATITGAITATSGAVGGFTLSGTRIYSTSSNIIIDSSTSAISIKSNAFGYQGVQLEYNSGTPRFYVGDGSNRYVKFDGTYLNISVGKNNGTTDGIIYKNGIPWLYDFTPSGCNGDNAFLGYNCGNLTMTSSTYYEASYNVGVGYACLNALTTGYRNVAVGYYAANNLTSGYDNICIGTNTGDSISSGDQNVAVGSSALGSVTTANANTAVGMGASQNNTSGYNNSSLGIYSLFNITSGYDNVGIGSFAGTYYSGGSANQTTYRSIYIGAGAYASANGRVNEIAIGYSSPGQGNNTIMLGNGSTTALYCYDTSISAPSDRRIKKNVRELFPSLSFINKLTPILYNRINPIDWDDDIKPDNYKDKEFKESYKGRAERTRTVKADPRPGDDERNLVGLIAQDVEKLLKDERLDFDLVKTSPNGMKAIAYGNLVVPLIKAVQELTQRMEILEGA